MDCKIAEDKIVPYLLGALDSSELSGIASHIDTCPECRLKLREEGEIVAKLAYDAPQLDVPPRVKQQLLSRIDTGDAQDRSVGGVRTWPRVIPRFGQRLVAHPGFALASTLVVVMVLGGIWFDNRLDETAQEKEALAAEMESVVESEAEMIEWLKDQRELISKAAAPGALVKTLSDTEMSAESRAWIVIEATGMNVTLSAYDMPPLGKGEVYQVWLVKDGQLYGTGAVFTVDSSRYGNTDIVLDVPLAEFEAMLITKRDEEDESGGPGPSILKGDM
jgi:hypothetical protein